ncbi:MAG: DUF1801 domain-containing protein, partial [Rhodobacterales bacterium]|nr:DUF1801 domain-containing protein [Rhodobacterales bacterium]
PARTRHGKPPPAVAAVFDAQPPDVRARLLALRDLILDTAAETPGVGPIEETLKWGEPAYLTSASGSGTTIRINGRPGPGTYALFVNCRTRLVMDIADQYPDAFAVEGNRALVLDARAEPPVAALRHAIVLALTYHARKKRRSR